MKKMVKVAIILTIITVLLLAILNSCARINSNDYKPVVSYESKSSEIAEFTNTNNYYDDSNINTFTHVLKYEQIILISSIVLVGIFTIIFFNITPKKKW